MKQTFWAPNYSPKRLSLRHLKKYNFPEKRVGAGVRYGEDYFTHLKQMQMDENFEKIILRYEMLSI